MSRIVGDLDYVGHAVLTNDCRHRVHGRAIFDTQRLLIEVRAACDRFTDRFGILRAASGAPTSVPPEPDVQMYGIGLMFASGPRPNSAVRFSPCKRDIQCSV